MSSKLCHLAVGLLSVVSSPVDYCWGFMAGYHSFDRLFNCTVFLKTFLALYIQSHKQMQMNSRSILPLPVL